jgi:hypothetical protein
LSIRYPNRSDAELAEMGDQIVLRILEWHLNNAGLELSAFDLPEPNGTVGPYNAEIHGEAAIEYLEGNDRPQQNKRCIPPVTLGADQQEAFNTIRKALEDASNPSLGSMNEPIQFFVHGEGGSGKTTLYKQLMRLCDTENLRSAAGAPTGMAASLLPGGQTVNSLFFIPNNVTANEESRLAKEHRRAENIRSWALLIIDEASQLSQNQYKYILRVLRDIRDDPRVDRRLVIVFGGDFRQILPIVPRGDVSSGFDESLIPEYAAGTMEFLCLRENHRTNADQVQFRKYLRDVGIARNPVDRANAYQSTVKKLPEMNMTHSIAELKEKIFPKDELNNPHGDWIRSAIVTPLNSTVNEINEELLNDLNGDLHSYEAVNTVVDDSVDPLDESAVNAMQEYMASIEETGLAQQTLKLKVGAKVMFMKNIDTGYRICNGTPAIVTACERDVVTVRRIESDGTLGEYIDVVRKVFQRDIDFDSHKMIKFRRVQFPLRLAWVMTINKCQGQTLNKVGILLNSEIFSHGQLYVAFSRVRKSSDIYIYHPITTGDVDIITNVVNPMVRAFIKLLHENIRPNRQPNGNPSNNADDDDY